VGRSKSSFSLRNPRNSKQQENLEVMLLGILCKHIQVSIDAYIDNVTPFTLEELFIILSKKGLRTTRETIRKTLERLISKGFVERDGKGLYICAPRQSTLDMFLGSSICKKFGKSSICEISLDSIEFTKPFAYEFLEKVMQKGIRIRKIKELNNKIFRELGASAVDDSSNPLHVHVTYLSHMVSVSARIRIGGIAPFTIEVYNSLPRVNMDGTVEFLPEHIREGGAVEFLVQRFKSPFSESRLVIENIPSDWSFEQVSYFARKLNEYDIIEFQLQLIEHAIDRAKRKASSFDMAIAFVDGSIIPGHLDPKITPDSDELREWPPDMAKTLIDRKMKILRQFLSIYDRILYNPRQDVVLVGAIKKAMDRSLQVEVNSYYDATDQELLSNALTEEDGILGPFKKHRVRESLVKELKNFSISYHDEINIQSYYIFKSRVLMPLQVDIVFPKDMGPEEREYIVDLVAHLVEESEKHTYIARQQIGEFKAVPTLRPIRLVDLEVSKKIEQITKVVEKELYGKMYVLLEYLAQLPITEGALFVYMSHLKKLRRLG